jgi:hypothetical protein
MVRGLEHPGLEDQILPLLKTRGGVSDIDAEAPEQDLPSVHFDFTLSRAGSADRVVVV